MDWSKARLKLKDWYYQHQRELPWRQTRDPYAIWLSEIILQQTRVEQGLPYYERFLRQYPEVKDLAQAPEEEVLRLWEGLGYYSRARNLHQAAKSIWENPSSDFPETYEEVRALKGVGDYTAAAISSFAYNLPYAVVDGNVQRVLSRLVGDYNPVNSSAGKKLFQKYADSFLDKEDPATHNQAIMEFGALQCKPKNPDCGICPLKEVCVAHSRSVVAELPVKKKKQYDQTRYLNYWYFRFKGDTWLERRSEGIWRGLFQFPLNESSAEWDTAEARRNLSSIVNNSKALDLQYFRLPKHKLSHQSLFITLWQIDLELALTKDSSEHLNKVSIKDLGDFALPRPLRKFLDENQLTLPLE